MTDDLKAKVEALQAGWRDGSIKFKRYLIDDLETPIYVDPGLVLPDRETTGRGNVKKLITKAQIQNEKNIANAVSRKWDALFLFYGIEFRNDAHSWEQMARALASQHVPGLDYTNEKPKPRKKVGRPRTGGAASDAIFILSIATELMAKKKRAVPMSEVLRAALKREPNRWRFNRADTVEKRVKSLQASLMRTLKRLPPVWDGTGSAPSLASLGARDYPNKTS